MCFAPPTLHDPGFRLPARLRSFHPGPAGANDASPEAIAGLGLERPLVYATLGTVFNDPTYDLGFFAAVQEGLVDAPVDVLMTLGPNADPAALGDPRPGVRLVAYVPQRAVMDRCAVVVCHGGYGTVLDAIDAAVPMVVVPFGADQFVNAAAVERLGIGIVVDDRSLSPRTLRAAVDSMLPASSMHRQRLQAIREAWRALPGPEEAAASVVELATG